MPKHLPGKPTANSGLLAIDYGPFWIIVGHNVGLRRFLGKYQDGEDSGSLYWG